VSDFEEVEFHWHMPEGYTITLPNGLTRKVELGDTVLGYFSDGGGIVVTGLRKATMQ